MSRAPSTRGGHARCRISRARNESPPERRFSARSAGRNFRCGSPHPVNEAPVAPRYKHMDSIDGRSVIHTTHQGNHNEQAPRRPDRFPLRLRRDGPGQRPDGDSRRHQGRVQGRQGRFQGHELGSQDRRQGRRKGQQGRIQGFEEEERCRCRRVEDQGQGASQGRQGRRFGQGQG